MIKPLEFVRCGYPIDIAELTNDIESGYSADIIALMRKIHESDLSQYPGSINDPRPYRTNTRKISAEIAHTLAGLLHYGGRERTIYTKPIPEAAGKRFWITNWKNVVTGKYSPASGGHGWGDEYDYDPPDLLNRKTHRIIGLRYIIDDRQHGRDMIHDFMTDSCNVRCVDENGE